MTTPSRGPTLIPVNPADFGAGAGPGGAAAAGGGGSPLVCQKCRRSLLINDSSAITEQSVMTFATGHATDSEDEKSKFVQRDTWAIEQLAEAFAMNPVPKYAVRAPKDAQGVTIPSQDPDKKMGAIQTLFEIAYERTGYEMPLCGSCSDSILAEVDKKLKAIELERKTYTDAFKHFDTGLRAAQAKNAAPPKPAGAARAAVTNDDVPPPPPPDDDDAPPPPTASGAPITNAAYEKQLAADEIANQKLEKELTEQIERIQKERLALKTELKTLELENRTLDTFEGRFWEDYQEFTLELDKFNEEQNSVKQKIRLSMEQLARMKRTNVYDDTFHISYDGHFGTINGFRLGQLPSLKVEWSEINAALGQVVLLLHTIARQANFKFTKYKLFPMGSFSKMGKKDEKDSSANELFGSGEAFLGRLFWFRRFDTALEWLLFCLKEFSDHAAKLDSTFKQRYPIKDETIGGVSIKLQFNQDAKWTKALKYLLTNLKYLLVWCSKRFD